MNRGKRPTTRKDLIDKLDSQTPPKSFVHIRKVLRQTIRTIHLEINDIEKEYVGNKRDVCDEIRTWVVPLKAVIRGAKVSELSSSRTIDSIFAKAATPGLNVPIDPPDLLRLRDCVMKVKEFVPFKFNRAVELTQKALNVLKKYCLSFYDMVNDPHLGTAHDYHTDSMGIADKVKILMERCRLMSFKFQTEMVTLHSDFFGSNARRIAALCECENIPFLVMFPQVCDNMREVATLLDRWVTADENYAEYLKHDINDIEYKRQQLLQKTRDLQENCWHLTYKLKQAQQENSKNMKELMDWKDRSSHLIVEDEMVLRGLNEKKVDLEIKEFKRAELVRNSDTLDPKSFQEQLDYQTLEIKKAKDEIKQLGKKLEGVRHKLNRCEERQDLLVSQGNQATDIQRELDRVDKARLEAETEMKVVVDKLEVAKRIHLQKTSVEMLEKIHYSLPLDAKSPRQPQSDELVTFNKACKVIAGAVGGDWCRLYRALPFVPARGKLNIESDIEHIVQANPRDGAQHHALRAIYRWRRFNNRVKYTDLLATLRRIRRYDIIDHVEVTLNPPVVTTRAEEPPPPGFLARHLIPCYKEVEKFDQLKAANRIPPLGWEHTRLIL